MLDKNDRLRGSLSCSLTPFWLPVLVSLACAQSPSAQGTEGIALERESRALAPAENAGTPRPKPPEPTPQPAHPPVDCPATAQTKLFGVLLSCATRDVLRRAAANAGARVVREDSAYWVDIYDSSSILDESARLRLQFVSATGEFASASYEFPSHVDTGQIDRIAKRVASKYGAPSESDGRSGLGRVSHRWRLTDGIEVEVHRGWPDTTTFLTYSSPSKLAASRQEIQAEQTRQEAGKNRAQDSAF